MTSATGLQAPSRNVRPPASTRDARSRETQMTTIEEKPATDAPAIDMDTLMAFVGKFVGDLGATIGAGNVLLGERLGLYRALAKQPGDARSLAAATDTDPRYVDEWLRGQAAGGYIEYDAASATYSMTPEQAFALTDPTGPVFLPGAFELALGALKAQHHIEESFRTGAGFGWGQHDEDVFTGCERFFRPGYLMYLLTELDPGPGRRAGQARARRQRGRPRLRSRCLDAADGRRVPGQPLRRLRLPHRLDRVRARARRGRRGRRPGEVRGGQRPGARGHGARSRHDVRLPARHGRPARRRPSTSAAPWPRTVRG